MKNEKKKNSQFVDVEKFCVFLVFYTLKCT